MAGVLEQLIKSADKGRLPHAILFWGPTPQKEKTTLAIELSRHLMGLKRKLTKKEFHRQAVDGLLIDFKMLTPDDRYSKDSIAVEQIDRLDEELALYPFESVNRIIYIPNAGLMTPQAQNSLLKKLEEPPANNYLVLDIPKPRTLLRTILSRCLVLYLSRPEESAAVEFEDYLHSLSNSDEAKKYLSKIEQLFGETESKGAAFLSFLRQILTDGTPLPDEEKLLLCAYALREKRPDIAHEILVQNDNPQRLSLDACYYHIAHTIVN